MPIMRIACLALLSFAVSGCGFMGRGKEETQVSAPAPESPSARAVSTAWTAARARKCGFAFDGAKLRSSFLAREARDGKPPEAVGQSAQAYDTALARFTKSLSGTADYCNDARVDYIRLDLNRNLSGDFAPAPKRPGDKVEQE